ncbi:MAG TPA: SURF1 family protein [Candidatus Corynebacterium gallistercoris]|uniref:SURF1-like protein n=1 Tax=Candidatus Corynebacterium gallistercoris TaxID=2838530 RepID=A0A9D1S120_9CORY|nr:SURF1 family protein [Candidatus Corynebacterium gallistercoris]
MAATGTSEGHQRRRNSWRSFITPGWVITAILVLTFTYFAFTFLAPWQLGKNKDKQDFNQRLEQSLQVDPVPIEDVIGSDGRSPGVEKEWMRVELQGHFLADDQVLLRNRPVNSSPAYQSLTPFALDSGMNVLVNRGWVPAGEGLAPDVPTPPTEYMTITGFIRMNEPKPAAAPAEYDGYTQVTGMNTDLVSEATGVPLAEDYVQIDQSSVEKVGQLNALDLPHLDSGQNLSYGIQWIAFGILAPIGLGWFIFAEVRERRREKQEIAEAAGAGVASPEKQQENKQQKLADRYGGTRSRFEERRGERGKERF